MPAVSLAVTTNGQRLGPRLESARRAGLNAATIHVDSLRAQRYRQLMGEGCLDEVLATIDRAKSVLDVVKLNVVVQRGLNDDELVDFLAWSRGAGVEVRFIELMNTGRARDFTGVHFIAGREILARIGESVRVSSLPRRNPSDPASLYRAGDVTFGLIASDTQPFCADCNRLRLSPTGQLRGCLYQPEGLPLGAALKAGAGAPELAELLRRSLTTRKSHHPLSELPRTDFSMADVGG
jgi:cyclic pyranopterin phosphate synthase